MKLEKGEEICDECDGSGKHHGNIYMYVHDSTGRTEYGTFDCERCNGSGKLDWLQKILNKRNFNFEDLVEKWCKEYTKNK